VNVERGGLSLRSFFRANLMQLGILISGELNAQLQIRAVAAKDCRGARPVA
jgi:hypothetical protein